MIEGHDKKEYWNQRVKDFEGDDGRMVWSSRFREEHLVWFKEIVSRYRSCSVLDIGCGWGRLADFFTGDYLGIDFSDKIIDLARTKYPNKKFEVQDAYTYTPEKKYAVILIFHLSGMGDREQELIKRYRSYANEALILVGGNDIRIINTTI